MDSEPSRERRAAASKFQKRLIGALCDFAVDYFELRAPRQDGTVLRDHLASAQRQKGKRNPRLYSKPPAAAAYLFDWFLELNLSRTSTGRRANPLPHSEVEAWARARGGITAFEKRALRRLDAVYVSVFGKEVHNDD